MILNKDKLKIFKFNKKKKYKLHKPGKLKKVLISIGLSLALLGAGTTGLYLYNESKPSSNYTYNAPASGYIQEVEEPTTYSNGQGNTVNVSYDGIIRAFEIQSGDDPAVEKKYSDVNLIISKNDYDTFINYINSLDRKYEYDDIYYIEDAISRHNYERKKVHSHDITHGTGVLDVGTLYNRVLENNNSFLNDKSNFISCYYEKADNDLVYKTCEIIIDAINTELKTNPDIDTAELFCNLDNMKILSHVASTANAFYSDNDILVITKKNIDHYQKINSGTDMFRQVVYHEVMHMIQSGCKDNELNNAIELGICYKYDDLKTNPFFWSWFLEASAEKEMAKVLGEETHTYSAPIGYYDSVILCSILNDNISVNDVEDISYDKRTEDIFKIFNATSQEEKYEIIKMMYSIDIMQSEPDDFYDVYKEKYGVDLDLDDQAKENLRLGLRVDILKTLSKEFYKSLANQVKAGNVTLDTAFYLINVYESDVYIHLFYNEVERIKSAVDFFDFYTELQNEFFKMIEPSVSYSYDQIIDMFNNYSMNGLVDGKPVKNYDLSAFGDEDASFIERKRMQNYQTGIPTIRSMPGFCKDKGYKK